MGWEGVKKHLPHGLAGCWSSPRNAGWEWQLAGSKPHLRSQCRGGQREKGKLNPGETRADEAPQLKQKWQKAGKPAERSARWSPCTKAAL